MEGIEAEITEKILERQPQSDLPPPSEVVEKVIEKPKKPRSQAQKDAFEKARKKRADNLALKKAERVEEELKSMNDPTPMEVMTQNKIEAPKKKRGRPKGSKKTKIVNEEPPLQQFIPPPQGYPPMPYPIQGHPQYYHQPPPPQPAPVNNYYYYGAPPHPQGSSQGSSVVEVAPQSQPELSPDPQQVVSFAEEELVQEYDVSEEEEYEIPIDPRHKFRFK
tara:strand:+ start:471 stop:1130 length:660 start_codon:yes stop_codon:yes gene_type:complete